MPVLDTLSRFFREYGQMMDHARTGTPPREWALERKRPYSALQHTR